MKSDIKFSEQQMYLKNERIYKNAAVLANVLELSSSVIAKVCESELSDTINGDSITKSVLLNIVANRIKDRVLTKGV